MTGASVRCQREGRWQNIEIDQLTDAELDAFAESQGPEVGWQWAKFLARWIRDHVEFTPEEGEPSMLCPSCNEEGGLHVPGCERAAPQEPEEPQP